MTEGHAFIKRQPVLWFYILAFVISWGGILLVVGPGGIPGKPVDFLPLLPLLLLAMLAGPTVAGIVMTALDSGVSGLRALFSGLLRWRVSGRWWAVALLTAPLVMLAIPGIIALFEPAFVPVIFSAQDKAALVAMGMGAGFSTLLEEIGWTGYAIPRLRLSHSVLKTGLITGFLWAAWHLLVNFWSSGDANGTLSLSALLLSLFFSWAILTSFRVLMVWVYEHTHSLLVAWLMHFTLTAGNVILAPTQPGGAIGPIWSLVIGAALWILVALIVSANRGRLEAGRPDASRAA